MAVYHVFRSNDNFNYDFGEIILSLQAIPTNLIAMRVPLFALCITFISLQTLNAQYVDRTNFRAGVNAGLVQGDFSESYSLVLGVDIYNHWGLSKTLDLGLATGFSNAFGEKQTITQGGTFTETTFDNIQFIPLAGSVRVFLTRGLKIGGDVGYGLGINKGNDGGLYYRPVLGVEMNGGSSEFNVSYSALNGETTLSSILAGFLFLF